LRGADAFVSQASPNLAVAFSGKYRCRQKLANLCQQLLIAENLGTSLVRFPWMQLTVVGGVKTRARQAPDRHYLRHTIRFLAGRRDGAAHGLDLQGAKGRPSSRRAIFSRNNSFSTLTLASTDFKRRFSSSSTSRLFRPISPLTRNRSRHSVKVATV